MTREKLEALETEVNATLLEMAEKEKSIHHPITDGVVDIDHYLNASPKMLWILKEPWEDFDEKGGGGWSVTKDLMLRDINNGTIGNKGVFAKLAYITYSVLNGYPKWDDIKYVTEDPQVPESLKNIAYINISKAPGGRTSNPTDIASHYQRNRQILKRQIDAMKPDIVIAGNVLRLFYDDFNLKSEDFVSQGSVEVCRSGGALYINAYHPAYWRIKPQRYCDDIVAAIKQHYTPMSRSNPSQTAPRSRI